jgi:hypothetical protein
MTAHSDSLDASIEIIAIILYPYHSYTAPLPMSTNVSVAVEQRMSDREQEGEKKVNKFGGSE